jgi:RNA polymerase sigma-70 factor (ECF subfamily)
VEKRLQRAKEEFRRRNLPLELPAGEDFAARLRSVQTCIYLLFNEGYNSSHPEFLIRKDLCLEALRLCRLVLDRIPDHPSSSALMSLMCFHAARFGSRLDDHGALVIFERQDRSRWNRELIAWGHHYLADASRGEELTDYHLEAAIAAEHCAARDFASTDWEALDRYYATLAGLKDNPIIDLNRAVILCQSKGPAEALRKLEELRKDSRLENYYLLHATLGEVRLRLGQGGLAKASFAKALSLTSSKTEIKFLQGKIEQAEALS